jgi:hypothetical protein
MPLIWIKARHDRQDQRQPDRARREKGCTRRERECTMQGMIGSSGMLRGWVAVWTLQMVWFAAMMTVTVGATATLELLFTGHARHERAEPPPHASIIDESDLEQPTA